ncbi:MAG TPA: response regulator [Planctomycetota bacterium]|jgi:CheY-like chemotaxis protein|nr:response regulator [Planctomycetota bacterium]
MPFPGERVQPSMLLVEDDADDRRFLEWAMRRCGLAVQLSTARDGEEAIEFLSHSPERLFLTLSDVHLPKKSGWDVLQWIRRQPACARMPVLIWTSLPNPEGELRAQQLGATSYFSKPLTAEGYRKLVGVIEEYLHD